MGVIRFLLAVAVVITHSAPLFGLRLVPGNVAVEAFFMISGYLMALVLNSKYLPGQSSYRLFLTNRLLRLFPVYWVVLALTVVTSFIFYYGVGVPFKLAAYQQNQLSLLSWLALVGENIFIVGQDLCLFLELNHFGDLFYTPDFQQTQPQVWQFLFVHQAWSLSIEIGFYIIAPFLVRRSTTVLLGLVAASLLLRYQLYRQGLYLDPWLYRFFPCELAFFLIGALAYRLYLRVQQWPVPRLALAGSVAGMVALTVAYQFLPDTLLRQVGYYACFAAALPFLFLFSKQSRYRAWDAKIGELSYPIYISHILVLFGVNFLFAELRLELAYLPVVVVAGSITFSLLLIRWIIEPVERIRQRRVTRKPVIVSG